MTMADIGIRLDKAPRRMSVEESLAVFEELQSKSPKGTRLATMTPEDVRKELETRD